MLSRPLLLAAVAFVSCCLARQLVCVSFQAVREHSRLPRLHRWVCPTPLPRCLGRSALGRGSRAVLWSLGGVDGDLLRAGVSGQAPPPALRRRQPAPRLPASASSSQPSFQLSCQPLPAFAHPLRPLLQVRHAARCFPSPAAPRPSRPTSTMSSQPRVTVERMDAASSLAERTGGMSLKTSTFEAPAGSGLQRNSLSRHEYGPSSPCSPVSVRLWCGSVGGAWGGVLNRRGQQPLLIGHACQSTGTAGKAGKACLG